MSQRSPPTGSPTPREGDDPPRLGAIRFGPVLAGGLYLLLVASAGTALYTWRFPASLPPALEAAAPWLFLAFAALFSVYRWVLIQRRKYPAFKGLFQIGVAVLFFMLLSPWASAPKEPTVDRLGSLLSDPRPEIRALAAEVAGSRSDGIRYGPRLVRALGDPDPEVREQAHRSLVRLAGSDLGPAEDAAAARAWAARFP